MVLDASNFILIFLVDFTLKRNLGVGTFDQDYLGWKFQKFC